MTGVAIPLAVADPLQMAWLECNDLGNAQRLVVLAGGLLKWVDDTAWLAFDGQRWSEREGQFRSRAVAHRVAQHIHEEVAALGALIGDPKAPNVAELQARYGAWCTPERALDRLKLLSGHAIKSGNANQTDAMLKQARDIPEMRAWGEHFDRDPLVYNVQNGTLRFGQDRGGKWIMRFQPGHDPTDMLRQIAAVDYDPAAHCPQWIDRLKLVQPDATQRGILPRMYGQTLTGLTDGEEFYVHKGRGGDGKTKTHEIIAHLHGDYYRHASVATFLRASIQKSGSEHRSDLVRLSGDIRMVICDEPPPGGTWDGEVLKQVTGGGNVTARGSGEKAERTFKPRWKLFVEVNPTPAMPGDDKGFRRRFRLIQWPVDLSRVPGGFEPPAQLFARLVAEKSGILNWMIAGCLEWLADRRVPKADAEEMALTDFWAQSSPMAEWLAEEADLTNGAVETGARVLLDAFKAWMERNDIEEEARKRWNSTRFGRDLSQRQIVGKKDGRGNKVRVGIRLRAAEPLAAMSDGLPTAKRGERSVEPTSNFSVRATDGSALGAWRETDDFDPFGD